MCHCTVPGLIALEPLAEEGPGVDGKDGQVPARASLHDGGWLAARLEFSQGLFSNSGRHVPTKGRRYPEKQRKLRDPGKI